MSTATPSTKTHTLLNPAQTAALQSYANGDFAHLAEIESEDEFQAEMQNCGDGLLRFLIVELATSEDCDSMADAIRRISIAIEDLEAIKHTLGGIRDASQSVLSVPGPSNWAQDARDYVGFADVEDSGPFDREIRNAFDREMRNA